MTIYLDIIFFENICMNYIILYATGLIRKKKIKNSRLILSSVIGSLYAIAEYIKIMNLSTNLIMKIALSVSMIWLAFNAKNYKVFFKDILIFYFISFIFGGCSFALIYFISPDKVEIRNGVLVGLYPIKITLIAGIVAFFIIQLAFKITKNKISVEDMICNITIYENKKEINVLALIDSGNMLKDPISGNPVIIVESEKVFKILPKEVINQINLINKICNTKEGGDIGKYNNNFKLRMIPFSSLGKQNGMLVGVKMSKIKIRFREKEKMINNVIIGIYDKKLTNDNKYNALIGLEIIDVGVDDPVYT